MGSGLCRSKLSGLLTSAREDKGPHPFLWLLYLCISMEGVVHHSIRYGSSLVGLALKINRFLIRVVLFVHRGKRCQAGACVCEGSYVDTYKKDVWSTHVSYCYTGIQMRKLSHKTWLKFHYRNIEKDKMSLKEHSAIPPKLCYLEEWQRSGRCCWCCETLPTLCRSVSFLWNACIPQSFLYFLGRNHF